MPSGPSMIRDVRARRFVVETCLSMRVERSRRISPMVCSYEGDCSRLVEPAYDFDLVFERNNGGSAEPLGDTRCP